MKFRDKFPLATPSEEEQYETIGDVVYKSEGRSWPCSICGEYTDWRSVGLEGTPVCGDECLEVWWETYYADCKEADAKYKSD